MSWRKHLDDATAAAEALTPERLVALGRRVVRSKHWGPPRLPQQAVVFDESCGVGVLPDLSDPATVGCLDALVQQAWVENPNVPDRDGLCGPIVLRSEWEACKRIGWRATWDGGGPVVGQGVCRVEALVNALENAP